MVIKLLKDGTLENILHQKNPSVEGNYKEKKKKLVVVVKSERWK